jgi:hypothetical protein
VAEVLVEDPRQLLGSRRSFPCQALGERREARDIGQEQRRLDAILRRGV